MLKRCLLLLGLLLSPAVAFGQGAVLQQGGAFQGHAAQFLSNGYIADAGGPLANGLSPVDPLSGLLPLGFASVNSGLGTCQFSGYASAPYYSLCWGFDGAGNGLLDYEPHGATPEQLYFEINGVKYGFPFVLSGIVGPNPSVVGDCALWNNTTGTLLKDQPCIASSTGALAGIPAVPGSAVLVSVNSGMGAGAPPVTYLATASPCPFTDGGYCFAAAVGGTSWVMAPQTVYDIRWWGLSAPIQFYADANAGNDYSGANFCVNPSLPCATIAQALTRAFQFCAAGASPQINLAAGTYGLAHVSGQLPCGGGQGFGGTGLSLKIVGAGSAVTTIADPCAPSCSFSVVNVVQGASLQISNLTVSAGTSENGIALTGTGDTFSIGGTDTAIFGNSSASAIHIEGQNRALFGRNVVFTVKGSWVNIGSADYQANFTFDGNVAITCGGGASFSGPALFALAWNSTIDFAQTETFPGCAGNSVFQAIGGSRVTTGSTDFGLQLNILQSKSSTDLPFPPCVGGTLGCAVATTPTGFGAGAATNVTSRSTAWGGQVQITAGTSPSTNGNIWLSIPVLMQTLSGAMITCTGDIGGGNGVTAFPNGSTAWIGADNASGGTNFRIDWQSPTPLTATDVYALNWTCLD